MSCGFLGGMYNGDWAGITDRPAWEDIPDLIALWDVDDQVGSSLDSRVGALRTLSGSSTTATPNWLDSGKSVRVFSAAGLYQKNAGGEGDIALGPGSALSVGAVGIFPAAVPPSGGQRTLFNDAGAPEPYALLLFRPGAGATVNLIVARQAGAGLTLITDVSSWLGLPFSYMVRMQGGQWACRLWVGGDLRSGSSADSGAMNPYNGFRVGRTSTSLAPWGADTGGGGLARLGVWQRGLSNSELEYGVQAGRAAYGYTF